MDTKGGGPESAKGGAEQLREAKEFHSIRQDKQNMTV